MIEPVITVTETVEVPIDSIRLYPGNAKLHNDVLLEASIRAHGQYRAIGVQVSTRFVIYGNGTYKAAKAAGRATVLVHMLDVDDEEARRINLIDNRAPEGMGYDNQALVDLLQGLPNLDDTGYAQPDLDRLIADLATNAPVTGDPDAVPAAPEQPVTAVGDLWLLGKHRLICGDAFDSVAQARLLDGAEPGAILTDPPYGMALDTDYRSMGTGNANSIMRQAGSEVRPRNYRPVIGDDKAFDARPLRERFARVKEQFWFGADYYRRTLSEDDRDGSWLIWDKREGTDGGTNADRGFGSGFETIWSAVAHKRDILRHFWFGCMGDVEARNREHPTQKPTKLLAEILDRWTQADDVILDPFAGSGSTLIACHQTGRRARVMELDPAYCDVICRRFQEATGLLPVLEATGEEHDFQPEEAA